MPAPISALPAEAGAHADRRLVTAERAADGDHRAIADRTLVTDRKRALAALETDAAADAVPGADAGGPGGHVEHGRAPRPLLVEAAVLPGQAGVAPSLAPRARFRPGQLGRTAE